MNNRELLELAAKAAGYRWKWFGEHFNVAIDDRHFAPWMPLYDDGDALRLAVKLSMTIGSDEDDGSSFAFARGAGNIIELHGSNPYAATRRAIVRAAAEIGKPMP